MAGLWAEFQAQDLPNMKYRC